MTELQRYQVIEALVGQLDQRTPLLCNIGDPCKELYAIEDRGANFYMLGSFGLVSSIGLGVALAAPELENVVVIDGDGSLLTNLGSLATIGRCQPQNLLLVVIDNAAYGSTGFQETATAAGVRLEAVAEGCAIHQVQAVDSLEDFSASLSRMLELRGPRLLLVRVNTGMPSLPLVALSPEIIRERFMELLNG